MAMALFLSPLALDGSRLANALRRKKAAMEGRLAAEGFQKELEEKLVKLQAASPPTNRLVQKIVEGSMEGRTAIVAEAARLSPSELPESLARRCQQYAEWGADAVAICTEESRTPDGIADLAAVCQAVAVPVLCRDWVIHPVQIVDVREAGAASLTAVYSILAKGTLPITQCAASVGLDPILEVVNLKEVEETFTWGVPLYGINISVGISVPMQSLREDIAKSLVQQLPFGAASVVGVKSRNEAVQMKLAGADAVYLKLEILQEQSSPQSFLQMLRDSLSGDD